MRRIFHGIFHGMIAGMLDGIFYGAIAPSDPFHSWHCPSYNYGHGHPQRSKIQQPSQFDLG
ncbi:MAG: hypothetical protein EA367_09200 [Leptolyngbya sp. DLM2.Bin15]|nr:MAG: hypothetical protein EA367_09200 [Leptolyngbya sp. DLM2.Bin15]